MAKTGRPTSFKPEYVGQAAKLCALGATDVDIADFFKVAVSTVYKWKHDFPAFSEALKSGKTEADDRVERSLYHKAVGYTFESEKVFQFQGQIVRTPTREHVPPDTVAAIFWLKNRRPEMWRDKTEQVVKHEFDNLDAEQRKQLVESINRELARREGAASGSGPQGPAGPVSPLH